MDPRREGHPNRFVSITFDDGLLKGALRAVDILGQFGTKATFYLVTGWVRPNRQKIRDRWNSGRDHGSWHDWRRIEDLGHEIGSHTVSHINAVGKKARLLPVVLWRELQGSFADLKEHLGKPPVSIAMPFNTSTPTSERLVKQIYEAARIGSQGGFDNDLAHINWYRLHSWAPHPEQSVEEIGCTITSIPPNHWIILAFHSLDDEGWRPISAEKLRAIMQFISEGDNLRAVTIREMVEMYKLPPACDLQRPEDQC
jgi:peptidoglycan/xylan/chitin deacetylase (PgdA/CDA1 family)